MTKRYYWLKLTEGILIRKVGNILVPYDEKHLAKITNTDFDTVVVAMELFKKIGLIQILEGGEIFIPGMDEMIGSETDKAKFMRNKRAKEKDLLQDGNKIEQSSNNVTQNSNKVTIDSNNVTNVLPKCYTEQEKDKEQEKELDIDKEQEIKQLENKVVDKLEGFDADAVYLLNYYLPNLSIQDKKRILIASFLFIILIIIFLRLLFTIVCTIRLLIIHLICFFTYI